MLARLGKTRNAARNVGIPRVGYTTREARDPQVADSNIPINKDKKKTASSFTSKVHCLVAQKNLWVHPNLLGKKIKHFKIHSVKSFSEISTVKFKNKKSITIYGFARALSMSELPSYPDLLIGWLGEVY